jgi:hypothetical protein
MSRLGTSDTVIVKPTNNVYTVLVFSSFLAVVGACLALFLAGNDLFGKGWLTGSDAAPQRTVRPAR